MFDCGVLLVATARVSVRSLIGLLDARDDEASIRASRIAHGLPTDALLLAGVQQAAPTGATLRVKYEMAQRHGAKVRGLEGLVGALENRHTSPVVGCLLESHGSFALVFLTEDLADVIGVLSVEPLRRGTGKGLLHE